jgi:hypothetical protein
LGAVIGNLRTRTAEAKTAEETSSIACETLAQDSKDIPFAFLYLADADGKTLHLSGVSGVRRKSSILNHQTSILLNCTAAVLRTPSFMSCKGLISNILNW